VIVVNRSNGNGFDVGNVIVVNRSNGNRFDVGRSRPTAPSLNKRKWFELFFYFS
jgi:hypothetical protein